MQIVFIFQAYNGTVDKESGSISISDKIVIEVFGESESDAVNRAKLLADREHYQLTHIIVKQE